MKLNKKFIIPIIGYLILTGMFAGIKTYAWGPDNNPYPEIDGWKGTNDMSLNGSGVEYNGIRIKNTFWCKPGDVLGVTAWGKELWGGDYKNTISDGYLCLSSSNAYSVYDEWTDENNNIDKNGCKIIKNSCVGIRFLESALGHGSPQDHYQGSGNLFWLKFDKDDMTYGISCNFLSFNGNYLNDFNDISSWTKSVETIKTDGKAPIVTLDPICHNWTNQNINVGVSVIDSGCGVQKYRYSICKNGIWQDYDWIYAKDHSNLSNAKFIKGESNSPEQISSSQNNINGLITLSGQGIYQVKVQAVDNLGNASDWQTSQNYYIDTTPPTGIFTPKNISSDSVVLNFKPYDEGGSGVLLWRYRLSKDNGSTWEDWSNIIDGDAAKDISIAGNGKCKVNAEVTDHAGNISEIYSQPYDLENSITVKASVSPNPAKQGQQITFDINTTGNAKYLTIYMPVEITSADTSSTIFPINKTIKEEQTHNEKIQYVIPLKTPQSIRKNESRVRAPYKIVIIAKKQDGKAAETRVDLDISGNVLDGIKTEIIGTGYDKIK